MKLPLSNRLSLLIFFMTLGTTSLVTWMGYTLYSKTITEKNMQSGMTLVATVADLIDAETVERYLTTLTPDENYENFLDTLQIFVKNNEIQYLYIVHCEEEGSRFIFDADTKKPFALGALEPWTNTDPPKQLFFNGEAITPFISHSAFGEILTVFTPLRYSDGSVAKGFYAGADFMVEELRRERIDYLKRRAVIAIAVTIIIASAHWLMVYTSVVRPVKRMTTAVQHFLVVDSEAANHKTAKNKDEEKSTLAMLSVQTGDELQILSESLKDMEEKIWVYIRNLNEANKRASTDALTQLHNREAFYNFVNAFLLRNRLPGQLHAFMILDIDKFKYINDTYGHHVGDVVLKDCAASLKGVFRSSDSVARMGGDEFTVFCPTVGSRDKIEQKARQIQTAFASIIPAKEAGITTNTAGVTASVGIVLVQDELITYEALFQKADEALYTVKTQGRNGYSLVTINEEHA